MAIRQAGAVTNLRRLKKRNQIAELEGRLSQFDRTLAAAEARKQQAQTAKFREDQLALEQRSQKQQQKQHKQGLAYQREADRKGMGLEAMKLGGSVLSSDIGFNFGQKNPVQPKTSFQPHGTENRAMTSIGGNSGGFFSGMNIGGGLQGAAGGAGIGFGLANMFGKGKKTTKYLGAGLGALGGFALGSGLLGSMFSGMGS